MHLDCKLQSLCQFCLFEAPPLPVGTQTEDEHHEEEEDDKEGQEKGQREGGQYEAGQGDEKAAQDEGMDEGDE